MGNVKLKKCKVCGGSFKPSYSSLQPCCSQKCTYIYQNQKNELGEKKQIKRISDKRRIENSIYIKKRKIYLDKPENKKCAINGPNCTIKATTIEHRMGRKGYADEQKRMKGISLFLDDEFWLPACNSCNLELENNTELSHKYQLSKIHGGKKQNK